MNASSDQRSNLDAYDRLKDVIARNYPQGQYVAIVHGNVVADVSTFSGLLSKLATIETDPDRRLVVQAGLDYPHEETIFHAKAVSA